MAAEITSINLTRSPSSHHPAREPWHTLRPSSARIPAPPPRCPQPHLLLRLRLEPVSQPRPASSPEPALCFPFPRSRVRSPPPEEPQHRSLRDRGAWEKSKACLPCTKSMEVREVAYQPLSETWGGTRYIPHLCSSTLFISEDLLCAGCL